MGLYFLLCYMKLLENNDMTCFPVYNIETSPLSAANTIDNGIKIPGVVQYSQAHVQLSLTVDSDLVVNEQYSATIKDKSE